MELGEKAPKMLAQGASRNHDLVLNAMLHDAVTLNNFGFVQNLSKTYFTMEIPCKSC